MQTLALGEHHIRIGVSAMIDRKTMEKAGLSQRTIEELEALFKQDGVSEDHQIQVIGPAKIGTQSIVWLAVVVRLNLESAANGMPEYVYEARVFSDWNGAWGECTESKRKQPMHVLSLLVCFNLETAKALSCLEWGYDSYAKPRIRPFDTRTIPEHAAWDIITLLKKAEQEVKAANGVFPEDGIGL